MILLQCYTVNAEKLLSAQTKYVIDYLFIMLECVLGQSFLWIVLLVWGSLSQ